MLSVQLGILMSNNKISFPIFIINLSNDNEKKQYMQQLCNKYNLYPEFIEAVDGRLLNDNDISAVYSKDKAIKTISRELSKGEIGCALSHIKIYQKMILCLSQIWSKTDFYGPGIWSS